MRCIGLRLCFLRLYSLFLFCWVGVTWYISLHVAEVGIVPQRDGIVVDRGYYYMNVKKLLNCFSSFIWCMRKDKQALLGFALRDEHLDS